jgi:hypothetical protein
VFKLTGDPAERAGEPDEAAPDPAEPHAVSARLATTRIPAADE